MRAHQQAAGQLACNARKPGRAPDRDQRYLQRHTEAGKRGWLGGRGLLGCQAEHGELGDWPDVEPNKAWKVLDRWDHGGADGGGGRDKWAAIEDKRAVGVSMWIVGVQGVPGRVGRSTHRHELTRRFLGEVTGRPVDKLAVLRTCDVLN